MSASDSKKKNLLPSSSSAPVSVENRKRPPPSSEANDTDDDDEDDVIIVGGPTERNKSSCQNGASDGNRHLSSALFGSFEKVRNDTNHGAVSLPEKLRLGQEREKTNSATTENTLSSLFDAEKANEYALASQRLRENHARQSLGDSVESCRSGLLPSSSSLSVTSDGSSSGVREEHGKGEHFDSSDISHENESHSDYYSVDGNMVNDDDDDDDDDSITKILKMRARRQFNESSMKATEIVTIDLSKEWPLDCIEGCTTTASVASLSTAGGEEKYSFDEYEEEEMADRKKMAVDLVGTIFRAMGVVVLKSDSADGDEEEDVPDGLRPTVRIRNTRKPAPATKVVETEDSRVTGDDSVVYMDENDYGSDENEVEMLYRRRAPSRRPVHLISPDLMDQLSSKAKQIEEEVCDRLDEKGQRWWVGIDSKREGEQYVNSNEEDLECQKMPSRETAERENEIRRRQLQNEAQSTFRYHEVASRCPGRLDVRYRIDEPPFNHPRIISNSILQPIIRALLGGHDGGATLLYAGLIFSFPHSSDQPWHMDGATLFPEEREWLDLPPYALNVFIPLDDITDDLGPTEFIPASHLAARANQIDYDLLQWAVAESSKETQQSQQKTNTRGGKEFFEEQWMNRHSVISPRLRRGDVLIYDYRVCHRGTRNLHPTKTRPMLYLLYARPWFKEHLNFGTEQLFPFPYDDYGGKNEKDDASYGS